ncbi:hypothetical protein PVK06_012793 [Gossypium arboreum]|uniref:Uncharacterized protein n=7 Tax=Gossypium TaxID=3633 RepID=A0ABR0QD78_GOSAR|nr:hypothetical protein PVK06_012793 [Gossypium arboreum]
MGSIENNPYNVVHRCVGDKQETFSKDMRNFYFAGKDKNYKMGRGTVVVGRFGGRDRGTRNNPQKMATLAAVAARRAATLARTPLSSQPASLIPRRGLAGSADHHGPPKVNFWQDPMSPSKWKEEHFVIVSLTGWGLLFFSGYKFFTKGKGKKEENAAETTH